MALTVALPRAENGRCSPVTSLYPAYPCPFHDSPRRRLRQCAGAARSAPSYAFPSAVHLPRRGTCLATWRRFRGPSMPAPAATPFLSHPAATSSRSTSTERTLSFAAPPAPPQRRSTRSPAGPSRAFKTGETLAATLDGFTLTGGAPDPFAATGRPGRRNLTSTAHRRPSSTTSSRATRRCTAAESILRARPLSSPAISSPATTPVVEEERSTLRHLPPTSPATGSRTTRAASGPRSSSGMPAIRWCATT